MKVRIPAALTAAFFVSSCGAVPWNAQNYAGITHADVRVCVAENQGPYICHAEIFDGKDKQAVSLHLEHPNGWKINYGASEVKSVDSQKVRAAVEQAVSKDLKDSVPGIVDNIIRGLGLP